MNKKELVTKVVSVLKDNDIRKYITAQKTVLHISDDNGNNTDFTVKKSDRGLLFTFADVENIIEATMAVIEDNIKNGESTTIYGFGSLGLNYRAERSTKNVQTGEPVVVPARYVPKFSFGNVLRNAARVYGMSLNDKLDNIHIPPIEPEKSEDD